MTSILLPPTQTTQRPTELQLERDVAFYLGRQLLVQRLLTSLPLVSLDAIVVSAVFGTLSFAGAVPLALSSLPTHGLILVSLCWMLMLASYQMYPGVGADSATELKRYTFASTIATALLAIAMLGFTQCELRSVAMLGLHWLGCVVALPTARNLARRRLAKTKWWGLRCIVIGDSATDHLNHQPPSQLAQQGYRVLGYVRCSEPYWDSQSTSDEQLEYLGPAAELHDVCRSYRAATLLIAADQRDYSEDALSQIALHVPRIERLDVQSNGIYQNRCPGLTGATHTDNGLLQPGNLAIKRCIDLVVVIATFPVLVPLLATIALSIKLTSPGPVFYRHNRLGRCGRTIGVWKFRTMVQNADQVLKQYLSDHPELQREWDLDHKLKRDPRVTRVGTILRKTSLDELPQLINVLTGQMSLVGPRPIVTAEIEKYAEAYPLYVAVQPGLTGLWQVSGRNNTTYARRIELDRRYVRSWSVWLDCCILMRTIKTVAFCEGAY